MFPKKIIHNPRCHQRRRSNSMPENPLHALMNPKSIAIVGASNNPMKMGTMQALSVLKDGYQGNLYPIHPKEKTVIGLPAYASPEELPETPDLGLIVVPMAHVFPLIEAFGRIGTKRIIVCTAGFKEVGVDGKRLELKLNETAARWGIRFVGPNCMGIINSAISLNLTVMRFDGRPGLLGLASQSGTYVTQTLSYLRKRGIRLSKAISTGNEANIDLIEAMAYLGEDEQSRAIILYIEAIRDGHRFIEAARKITPYKPVFAQYVGGSAAGAKAGLSHTGAMAGPDFLYEGIFKQAGIIRVHSIEDLYAHGWTAATQPQLKGNRIAIVTHSGGPGTAMSNVADQGGLTIPTLSERVQSQIRPHIPPHASSANPVDLTFNMDTDQMTVHIPEILFQSGEIDGMIIHGPMTTGWMKEVYHHLAMFFNDMPLEDFITQFRKDLSEAMAIPAKYKMPLLICSFLDRSDNFVEAYEDNNVPVLDAPEKAARAMLSLLRHKEIRERKVFTAPVTPPKSPEAEKIIRNAVALGQKALDEAASKQILALYGIPVTREQLTASLDEALAAATSIGYPVALKACDWEIMHKTGKGLIALNVKTDEELQAAFDSILQAAGRDVPVLIQEMLAGGRELVVGMTRFPGFDPCILFGLGGIFTEVLKDNTLRLAPLSAADAEEMLDDIKGKALLDAFRGMPAANRTAITGIVQTLGFIALLHPEIAEIDLNPVIITGTNPVVADALFVLKG
jgi:acetate---CoA ligase (ADP-forming)